jgi:hypothetical protein
MRSIHPKTPGFEVSDLGAAKQHLICHGVILIEEMQNPGQIRFSFFDPINNRIELLQKI